MWSGDVVGVSVHARLVCAGPVMWPAGLGSGYVGGTWWGEPQGKLVAPAPSDPSLTPRPVALLSLHALPVGPPSLPPSRRAPTSSRNCLARSLTQLVLQRALPKTLHPRSYCMYSTAHMIQWFKQTDGMKILFFLRYRRIISLKYTSNLIARNKKI